MLEYMQTTRGATTLATIIILGLVVYVLFVQFRIKPSAFVRNLYNRLLKRIGLGVNYFEQTYKRNVEIGRLNSESKTVKAYKWLNDLTIDLGYKEMGITPYTMIFIVMFSAFVISVLIGALLFQSTLLAILGYMPVLVTILCGLYTKANLAHDNRIEDVINAENIISNNIEKGVLVAVKDNFDSLPRMLQPSFRVFIDDIESKNYHIKTALEILNSNLGTVSDDFIQKCITFELEEEAGLAGIFKDVVEVNNIRSELRINMKRKFEKVTTEFIICVFMVFVFLGGAISIYPILRTFYFGNILGQIILMIDIIILVAEFVYITALRATEI